jgi:DNA topoisomerase-2
MLSILAHQLKIISYKVKFILQVIDKKIEINNKKKLEIEEKLVKLEFPKLNVSRNKDEGKASYDYLLSMPIYNLTNEKIEELKKQEQDKQAEYDDINSKTPEVMWGEELEILEAKYIKWVERKIEEATSTTSVKVKKTKK